MYFRCLKIAQDTKIKSSFLIWFLVTPKRIILAKNCLRNNFLKFPFLWQILYYKIELFITVTSNLLVSTHINTLMTQQAPCLLTFTLISLADLSRGGWYPYFKCIVKISFSKNPLLVPNSWRLQLHMHLLW